MRKRFLTLLTIAGVASCQPTVAREQPAGGTTTIVTDSSQYTVRRVDGMYRATIGYAYTNRTGDVVSMNYCRSPTPPTLEKNVGGRWVRAYAAVTLMCLTHPPFRIAAGDTYRGTLGLAAAPRGSNAAPQLEVDSVPGTYRLRWTLRAGSEPDAPGAGVVEAISNEFRLTQG